MITYLNEKNASDYHVLFSKATEVLKEAQPESIGDSLAALNLTWDDFAIGSLNEYFAYLQDILAVTEGDRQKFFVRLPLDEDVFTINADTRTITVPTSFARNGIGVQGDEMAEVVYFTIDRFFDSIDLAGEDVNIAIQWETRDKNKQVIQGISKNFGKDIESIKGKIIFGWPISHELTQTNSIIKFAVRFYIIDTVNGERQFTYSFTTLPAEVGINASLDYDLINNAVREIDYGQILTNRIKNYGIYDESMEKPEPPIVTTNLHVMVPTGYENTKIIDLPIDSQTGETTSVTLAIAAKPSTSGVINYIWKKYPYDNDGGYDDHSPTWENADTITTQYIEETNDIPEDTETIYYEKIGTVYQEIKLSTTLTLDLETNSYKYDDGFEPIGGGSIKLYKKISQAVIHGAGQYAVDIAARILVNTIVSEMSASDVITIPGPKTPEVNFDPAVKISVDEATNQPIAHMITSNNGTVVLKAKANPGETGKPAAEVGENPQVTLTYVWKKENGDPVASGNGIEYTVTTDQDGYNVLTISGLATEGLEDIYYVDVTATRNGSTITKHFGNYRVTNGPVAPQILSRVYNNQTNKFDFISRDYTSEDNIIHITRRPGAATPTLSFSVAPLAKSDELTYVWMRIKSDPEVPTDWEEDTPKLQVDLDEAIEGLSTIIGNPQGDADYPVEGATIDNAIKYLNNIADLGTVENLDTEDNGPKYTVKAEDPQGLYYCIVINKFNGYINANVSPFFDVV